MTPIDKNNEPLDAVLRRAMRAEPGPATPECADAESLAAYSERSLATAHRERLEAHFADCMRCQMLLADLARADESARGAPAESAVPWYRRWRVAIPALAAVAAIVVFIAMRRPVNEAQRSDHVVAMAKNEAPAMQLAERAEAPEASKPAAAPVSASAPPASSMIAMNEAKTAAVPRAEAMSGGALLHHMAEGAAAPGARAMTANAAAPMAAAGAMTSSDAATANSRAFVMVSPPDRSVMWVVGAGGMIRRMSPHGTQVQQSHVTTDLVAGAAPSATVCWVVGKKGTVVRTIDGEHWQTVAAPTADDLNGVTASSADNATITTARGKSFATSDGGVSWRAQ